MLMVKRLRAIQKPVKKYYCHFNPVANKINMSKVRDFPNKIEGHEKIRPSARPSARPPVRHNKCDRSLKELKTDTKSVRYKVCPETLSLKDPSYKSLDLSTSMIRPPPNKKFPRFQKRLRGSENNWSPKDMQIVCSSWDLLLTTIAFQNISPNERFLSHRRYCTF